MNPAKPRRGAEPQVGASGLGSEGVESAILCLRLFFLASFPLCIFFLVFFFFLPPPRGLAPGTGISFTTRAPDSPPGRRLLFRRVVASWSTDLGCCTAHGVQ